MGTITKGIVSGINRMVSVDLGSGSYLMEVIQTDASINSGNSGGPICNIRGEVVGITSSKYNSITSFLIFIPSFNSYPIINIIPQNIRFVNTISAFL